MISIIDDYLDRDSFDNLSNTLTHPHFPWFYQNGKLLDGDEYFQFTHLFYDNFKPNSQYMHVIEPLVQAINPTAIIRIKANLTTRHDAIHKYPLHVDIDNISNAKTAIYYCNDNDGYTYFEDGTKVDSVSNRLVVFNTNTKHSGTTHTDTKTRCVINLNYYS